jgi:hypothetical protein
MVRGALELSSGWWRARRGVAQGSPLSPLLANVALTDFDRTMQNPSWLMVRYADDLVVLSRSAEDAGTAHRRAQSELKRIGLTLHPDKTRVVDSRRESFSFLGFDFHPDRLVLPLYRFRATVLDARSVRRRLSGGIGGGDRTAQATVARATGPYVASAERRVQWQRQAEIARLGRLWFLSPQYPIMGTQVPSCRVIWKRRERPSTLQNPQVVVE